MNKKVNTVLFILGATIVNILIMVAIFLLLFTPYVRFLAPQISPQMNNILAMLIFIGSIVATYFIYHWLVKFISKKYDLDRYFDPLFKKKGK